MLVKTLIIIGAFCTFVASQGVPRLYKQSTIDDLLELQTDPIDGVSYRLPNNTRPLNYDVFLKTDIHLGNFDFNGVVTIKIQAIETTNNITLHVRQLAIDKIDLRNKLGELIESNVSYSIVDVVEFLMIEPTVHLVQNEEYIIEISYHGVLRRDEAGFYRSSYVTPEGMTRWLATTQFESTDARHGFPCYDEPQIRTPFTIRIQHDNSYFAASNAVQRTRTAIDETNYVITTFFETPPMQTYLIAFIISDFKYIQENHHGKTHRILAKPQSINAGDAAFAMDAGKRLLVGFEQNLMVPYSLPKMDQAAIPNFAAGAMENWGLVTYREQYLLWNAQTGTTGNKESIIRIISHEFAHQWFGNLVAPQWWSFLWLNEGFATFYSCYLTDIFYPEDRFMDTFLIDYVQYALEVDANPNIRPMSYYVESPNNIDRLFDSVAYDKSGSVLRMMQNGFGSWTWRYGMLNYLRANSYKAASPSDLYAGLQLAVNQDFPMNTPNVETIMRTWETQSGYPVIHVSRNGNQLILTQERFFYSNTSSSNNIWWVPINYASGSDPDFTNTLPDLWMNAQTITLENSSAPKPWTENDWIVLNIQQTGYYRVNYDDNLWELIIKQLNGNGFDNIHLLNRAQLIDDSHHLARAGKITYKVLFSILNYLNMETDYIPWASANRGLTLFNRYLTGSSVYSSYQAFIRRNVEMMFNRLGVDAINNEPKLDRYARNIAINVGCQANLESCLTQTAARLRKVITDGTAVALDHVNAIYCNGLRYDDYQLFFNMQNKMFQSSSQTERNSIITGMGCSQNSILLNSFLNLALIPGSILSNTEKSRILSAPVTNGIIGPRLMISFIRTNYRAITSIASNQVTTMLSNIASRVASQELYSEFVSLLSYLQQVGVITENNGNNYRNTANINFEWQSRNLGHLEEFFGI